MWLEVEILLLETATWSCNGIKKYLHGPASPSARLCKTTLTVMCLGFFSHHLYLYTYNPKSVYLEFWYFKNFRSKNSPNLGEPQRFPTNPPQFQMSPPDVPTQPIRVPQTFWTQNLQGPNTEASRPWITEASWPWIYRGVMALDPGGGLIQEISQVELNFTHRKHIKSSNLCNF